jgi:mannose-6-phosphate isomerase-like protein (cupin superfamily)
VAGRDMGARRALAPLFDRCNLEKLPLEPTTAHGGEGRIRFARVLTRHDVSGPCNFIDLAVLPPGTSIGLHRHGDAEEEYYLVLGGTGEMRRNGESFPVETGDLVRNPCGGTHALVNTGTENLKIFVFELAVTR